MDARRTRWIDAVAIASSACLSSACAGGRPPEPGAIDATPPPIASTEPSAAPTAPARRGAPFVIATLAPPPRPLCVVSGSGRPFRSGCGGDRVAVATAPDLADPIALVDLDRIHIRIQIAEVPAPPWVEASDGTFMVRGYADFSKETFRLARDASAFDGHVRIKRSSPVTLASVSDKTVGVVTTDDTVDVSGITAEVGCDGLDFTRERMEVPPITGVAAAGPKKSPLHLKTAPGARPFFTLHDVDGGPPTVNVEIKGRTGNDLHVVIDTEHVVFDAWVDAAEIDPQGAAFGAGGLGLCGSGEGGPPPPTWEAIEETDVLVSEAPSAKGPPGVRLLHGARVGGTISGSLVQVFGSDGQQIFPPDGRSFFVPLARLKKLD